MLSFHCHWLLIKFFVLDSRVDGPGPANGGVFDGLLERRLPRPLTAVLAEKGEEDFIFAELRSTI